jgi:glycosyltransferase involved in cell wall biosynthesis
MTIAPARDLDGAVLVDLSNFTIPYDLPLAGAMGPEGRDVRLFGQAGESSHGPPIHHGYFYSILASGWERRLPKRSVRWVKGMSHAFDLLPLSQTERRVAAMDIHPAQIYRIPHGLLGSRAHVAGPRVRGASRDRLVLLQFGKIKPYKGVDLLLQALTLIPKQLRSRLDVRIVGKPYRDLAGIRQFYSQSLRFEFVSDYRTGAAVRRGGRDRSSLSDINASGVAMSAIARGLRVLATAIDGFRELFEERGGPRLVAPADATAMANGIADWIIAPGQLDTLAEAMWSRRASVPSGVRSPASTSLVTPRLGPDGWPVAHALAVRKTS